MPSLESGQALQRLCSSRTQAIGWRWETASLLSSEMAAAEPVIRHIPTRLTDFTRVSTKSKRDFFASIARSLFRTRRWRQSSMMLNSALRLFVTLVRCPSDGRLRDCPAWHRAGPEVQHGYSAQTKPCRWGPRQSVADAAVFCR